MSPENTSGQTPPPAARHAVTLDAPGLGNAGWRTRYEGAVMNTFGTPRTVLTHAAGAHVWDADGREYVDLLAGIAVNALGHAHPAVVAAVTEQVATLGHISNLFTSPAQIELAEALRRITFADGAGLTGGPTGAGARVFLSNSGTEANEAAFKIARRHGGSARPRVLALEHAFHGRTMGALALTHHAAYREPFEPLPGGVEFLPAGDVDVLREALGPDVAALIVEPIQGEAGVRELPTGYLEAARELTEAAGALLILDEVQTGMGRTGTWMGHHCLAPGVVPDVVTLAKGLGGGMPIGATVAFGEAATLLGPGQHGTTFGGNPVCAAAALAVIDAIESEGLLARVTELGTRWATDLASLPGVSEVRGRGLLRGVGLAGVAADAAVTEGVRVAKDVADDLLEAGFIVNPPRPDTIRLAPPLTLSDADADAFTRVLGSVLATGNRQ